MTETKNVQMTFGQLLALSIGDPLSPGLAALSDDVISRTAAGAFINLPVDQFALISSGHSGRPEPVIGATQWPESERQGYLI